MEIYFRVYARQCGNEIRVDFPDIESVRFFLRTFISAPSYCAIRNVKVFRCYMSFDYTPETIDIETILFHWGDVNVED